MLNLLLGLTDLNVRDRDGDLHPRYHPRRSHVWLEAISNSRRPYLNSNYDQKVPTPISQECDAAAPMYTYISAKSESMNEHFVDV